VPSLASNSAIRRDSVETGMPRARAAREKFFARATATNSTTSGSSANRSGFMPTLIHGPRAAGAGGARNR